MKLADGNVNFSYTKANFRNIYDLKHAAVKKNCKLQCNKYGIELCVLRMYYDYCLFFLHKYLCVRVSRRWQSNTKLFVHTEFITRL